MANNKAVAKEWLLNNCEEELRQNDIKGLRRIVLKADIPFDDKFTIVSLLKEYLSIDIEDVLDFIHLVSVDIGCDKEVDMDAMIKYVDEGLGKAGFALLGTDNSYGWTPDEYGLPEDKYEYIPQYDFDIQAPFYSTYITVCNTLTYLINSYPGTEVLGAQTIRVWDLKKAGLD